MLAYDSDNMEKTLLPVCTNAACTKKECSSSKMMEMEQEIETEDGIIELEAAEETKMSPLDELYLVVKEGKKERVDELLSELGEYCIDTFDTAGHTLVHWAAHSGNVSILNALYEKGFNMNTASKDQVRLHPIHWTCTQGHLAALHFFIQKIHLGINTVDTFRHRTPLLLAAQHGFPLLVLYCVKNGANIDLLDIDLDSAVHWAAYKGASEIVSVFHYLDMKVDSHDHFGQTPLHLAAMQGHLHTVQYLVEEWDADILVVDAKDRTPTELSVLKEHMHVTDYLRRYEKNSKWITLFQGVQGSEAPFYFVLLNFLLPLFLYQHIIYPAVPDHPGLYMLHFLLYIANMIFFIMAWKTSPGDCSSSSLPYKDLYTDRIEAIAQHGIAPCHKMASLCHTCHIERPIRAKHCRYCKTCVAEEDHHCPFIGNCVGQDNYGSFFGYLATTVLGAILFVTILYQVYATLDTTSWIAVIGMVYYSIACLVVAHLFAFHVYLTCKNLTTNEVANYRRYAHFEDSSGSFYNPFDRGVFYNITSRIFPSIRGRTLEEATPMNVDIV